MAEEKKHIHTYKRVPGGRSQRLYMCADPHCLHRMSKIFLLGKASLCNICGEEFSLDDEDLKLAKPLCHRICSKRTEFIADRERRKLLEEIGI